MKVDSDLRRRLEELEQLLVQHRTSLRDTDRSDGNSADVRIDATLDRLRELTTALQREHADSDDPLSRVTMRLMLEDYAVVLSQLRASVSRAGQLLSSVEKTVVDGQRFVRRVSHRRSR